MSTKGADGLMDTVSILIPCYNDEEYVGAAVAPDLSQAWLNYEVIVIDNEAVDDGSDDASRSVARCN
ncbi:glycosyltransferase family 2 protein [Salinibacter ruber]|uniref:glycosyltransferase family 2 protein n=1 Tax=Salinibacter ruber TaxID=146919 RepID=UPI0021698F39|nr:glycosyltransferase [Salinibacter ruber]MCS4136392.1 glycosyltransferase involved in cell wall biosynthesis [Salinibacter ruber]